MKKKRKKRLDTMTRPQQLNKAERVLKRESYDGYSCTEQQDYYDDDDAL